MILFIDDDGPVYLKRYKEAVEARTGHGVQWATGATTVEDALWWVRAERKQIKLVILDIAMAGGTVFPNEVTKGGKITGLLLYDRIRQLAPELPVLIFTQMPDLSLPDRFGGGREKLCWFAYKPDYEPDDLAALVATILASGSTS